MADAPMHVKKGDKVVVVAGAYKSNEPKEVLRVDREKGRVVVKDVNVRWKHQRRSQANPQGGRVQKEFPIDASNVLLFSEKQGKGVRTRIELKKGEKKKKNGVERVRRVRVGGYSAPEPARRRVNAFVSVASNT